MLDPSCYISSHFYVIWGIFSSLFRTWNSKEAGKSNFLRLLPHPRLTTPTALVRASILVKKHVIHCWTLMWLFFSFESLCNRQFGAYAGRFQEDGYIYRYGPQLQSADAVNQWTGIVCSSVVLWCTAADKLFQVSLNLYCHAFRIHTFRTAQTLCRI